MIGTPDSWDPTISTSGKDDYEFCTWSQCGRFVAALTGNTIEIRNQLTFELIITLKPTEATPLLTGPLSYSPDGRSIACASDTAIMIWDIQTGGVAKKIVRDDKTISLVWSLDGRTIGTLNHVRRDTKHARRYLNVYEVASGAPLFTGIIHSTHKPFLWASKQYFRVMTADQYPLDCFAFEIEIKVFEIRSQIVKIHAFDIIAAVAEITTNYTSGSEIISFSPTTCRVSALVEGELLVFQDQELFPLLRTKGHFLSHCFSVDGSLFAASKEDGVHIWKHTSKEDFYVWERTSSSYTIWKEFRCQSWTNHFQLSPSPSSILSHSKNILRVWRLYDLPASPQPPTPVQQHVALSRSGSSIAATNKFGTIIKIMDHHSRVPLQFIHTWVCIQRFFFTSNVLLVVGSGRVVAWMLTEEGLVRGAFNDMKPNYEDKIWAIPFMSLNHSGDIRVKSPPRPKPKLTLRVEGQIGTIEHSRFGLLRYNTVTGEIVQSTQTPLHLNGSGLDIGGVLCGRHHPYCHTISQCDTSREDGWYPSETALREGWVKDPEGRHRLWLHIEWRKSWYLADWRHDITTQFSIIEDQPVVIKF